MKEYYGQLCQRLEKYRAEYAERMQSFEICVENRRADSLFEANIIPMLTRMNELKAVIRELELQKAICEAYM